MHSLGSLVVLVLALGMAVVEGVVVFAIVYFATRLAIRHERRAMS
jgi:uncharacterized membrane protein YciS (DUF1049 family)